MRRISAQGQVGLMLNVEKSESAGSAGGVAGAEFSDGFGVVRSGVGGGEYDSGRERVARDVIPRLKAAKATGIVEYPLNKVVL